MGGSLPSACEQHLRVRDIGVGRRLVYDASLNPRVNYLEVGPEATQVTWVPSPRTPCLAFVFGGPRQPWQSFGLGMPPVGCVWINPTHCGKSLRIYSGDSAAARIADPCCTFLVAVVTTTAAGYARRVRLHRLPPATAVDFPDTNVASPPPDGDHDLTYAGKGWDRVTASGALLVDDLVFVQWRDVNGTVRAWQRVRITTSLYEHCSHQHWVSADNQEIVSVRGVEHLPRRQPRLMDARMVIDDHLFSTPAREL